MTSSESPQRDDDEEVTASTLKTDLEFNISALHDQLLAIRTELSNEISLKCHNNVSADWSNITALVNNKTLLANDLVVETLCDRNSTISQQLFVSVVGVLGVTSAFAAGTSIYYICTLLTKKSTLTL